METYTRRRYKAYGLDHHLDKPLCQKCRRRRATEIHHIRGRIGKLLNDIRNLIALCRECHVEAHASNTEETKQELEGIVKKQLDLVGFTG